VTSVIEAPVAPGHGTRPSGPLATVAAYVALTKPRIIELLLVSTVPTMFLAQGGLPSLWLIVATLIGGSLAAGSANALNCYIDRDIDEVMSRTSRRPLARHTIAQEYATIWRATVSCVATTGSIGTPALA